MTTALLLLFAGIAGAAAVASVLWKPVREARRAAFINDYRWPEGLLEKLEERHGFTRKQSALVATGLRHFFLAYLKSGRRYVAMPSQVADDLWHEFILYTREYQEFCNKAFGEMLHHRPAVVLKSGRERDNEGLRRVWWQCCKMDAIDPRKPTRLPLLFALDTKLNIPNGFVYRPDSEPTQQQRRRESSTVSTGCGGGCSGGSARSASDFSSRQFDGTTDGFGDSVGDAGGGGDGGGGCGGGCGGD
jgi:hypothetical protein